MTAENPFQRNKFKKRSMERMITYAIIVTQGFLILWMSLLLYNNKSSSSSSGNSTNPFDFYNLKPSYKHPPLIYPEGSSQIVRVWHSNGSPFIHPDLKKGSCWCSADEYCMCTPSMAIDTILTSGEDHVWLVKRKDQGKYATMGGFVEVGETSEDAVKRELMEEMNVRLEDATLGEEKENGGRGGEKQMRLFGIYDDPRRDARRHSVSVVYVVDIPLGVTPKAGDDAAQVVRVSLDEIQNLTFFADHKKILLDYMEERKRQGKASKVGSNGMMAVDDHVSSIRRSLCV
jgi:ADP-ribose pyrophosphatase